MTVVSSLAPPSDVADDPPSRAIRNVPLQQMGSTVAATTHHVASASHITGVLRTSLRHLTEIF
jgi:hypothetical protein